MYKVSHAQKLIKSQEIPTDECFLKLLRIVTAIGAVHLLEYLLVQVQ